VGTRAASLCQMYLPIAIVMMRILTNRPELILLGTDVKYTKHGMEKLRLMIEMTLSNVPARGFALVYRRGPIWRWPWVPLRTSTAQAYRPVEGATAWCGHVIRLWP